MRLFLIVLTSLFPTVLWADAAEIVAAQARNTGGTTWNISVTIRHPDTGWDHYADGWEVLAPNGDRLGYRELFHPHVDEQPFTRSLGGVDIPTGTPHVLIRARDNQAGWDTETYLLQLR